MLEWDILSVYPYKEENIQEILCRIYSIVEELKKNGQVVPPELIADIERIKEEFKVIKGQLGEELQKKIDEALKSLNAVVDGYMYSYSNGGSVIKDSFITDYTQELTGGKYIWRYNNDEYGGITLKVKNGIGTITGCYDLRSTISNPLKKQDVTDPNIQITIPIIATKQVKSILDNTILWNKQYNKYANLPLVLNRNGSLSIDSNMWKSQNSTDDITMYGNINLSFPIVKSYVKPEHIQKVNSKIATASNLMQELTSSVVIACDSHIRPTQDEESNLISSDNNLYTPLYINYINSRMGAFATINNGDTIHESNKIKTKQLALWAYESIRKMYNENTVFVLGNHDDNSMVIKGGQQVTKEEFNLYMNKGKSGVNFASNNQPYFYMDDTKGRCRHICLNTHDKEGEKIGIFEISAGQLNWLIQQLHYTPAGYSIVIYTHAPTKTGGFDPVKNGDKLHEILVDYKQRNKKTIEIDGVRITYDFSFCKGNIACVISGHDHLDRNDTIDGINYSIETTSSPESVTEPTYTICLVDSKHRQIRLLRGGFGRVDQTIKF